jgi:hypothetical protein
MKGATMADLIDRQAAIDALEGEIEVIGKANAEAVLKYTKMVCDRIKALPSAQSEPRWIDCKERLPEDERYVLVTTVSGDVTEAKYWQKEGFWVLKGLAIMSVTAWMPLPKRYERS